MSGSSLDTRVAVLEDARRRGIWWTGILITLVGGLAAAALGVALTRPTDGNAERLAKLSETLAVLVSRLDTTDKREEELRSWMLAIEERLPRPDTTSTATPRRR